MNVPVNVRAANAAWLQIVQEQVDSLRFGMVQIVVHEGQVVQVERTEKLRLDRTGPGQASSLNPRG